MNAQRAGRLKRTGTVLWVIGVFAVGAGLNLSDPWIGVVTGTTLLITLVFQGLLFFSLGESENQRKELRLTMEYVTEVTGTSLEELTAQARLKRVQEIKAEPHLLRQVKE